MIYLGETEKKKMISFCESYYNNFATNDDILRLCVKNGIKEEHEVKKLISVKFTFVDKDIFLEKNHDQMMKKFPDLINGCHGNIIKPS